MRRKVLFLGFLPVFLLAGTLAVTVAEPLATIFSTANAADEMSPDQYDAWLNSISQPGHLYLHYNRGNETNYDDYCLWLWQSSPQDLEGALWGFSGNVQVSPKLKLQPMSTSWMTHDQVGKSGSGTYYDAYGAIMDVDLYRSDLKGGKTGEPVTYEGAEELGFLLPQQKSMDGSSNWVSDGGRETYIDDIADEANWRTVDDNGGKAVHIFVSKGSLANYKYFAGDGVPDVKINPIDTDTTGKYSSAIEEYADIFGVSSTSEAFKKLGVGYQIFVASFRDSNGDGIGDIRGIIDSLDYLKELGVDVLWLTPIQKSDSYHGYDISDYLAVDKRFGTIEDYRELIYKAHKMGMKVLMDLVLNHTSKGNPWFINSQWGSKEDGSKNEWRDVFTWKFKTDKIDKYINGSYQQITVEQDATSKNPSWYRDGESNYYYYGKFGSGMPEINYQNAKTRDLVVEMAKYWLSFGLDGYRLDAVKHIFMRDECYQAGDIVIPDTGSKKSYDDEKGEYVTKEFDYSSNLTKNVAWWKEFANRLKADYPNCFLVGENFDGWGTRTAPYYQALDSQFSFSTYYHIPAYLYNNAGGASNFQGQAAESFDTYASNSDAIPLADTGIYVPGGHRPDFIDGAFTSNHDVMRAINQVNGTGTKDGTTALTKVTGAGDEVNKAKIHAAVTLLNPGVSWIYYGDELGMSSNTDSHVATYGSENCEDIWYRQPFLWKDVTKRADYKSGQYKFELDSYNKSLISMEDQKTIQDSMYNWYKDLCEIKHMYPAGAKVEFSGSTNVLVIKVKNPNDVVKLTIYINTGYGQTQYLMNPNSMSAMTAIKTMGGAPAKAGDDIGATRFSIAVFKH